MTTTAWLLGSVVLLILASVGAVFLLRRAGRREAQLRRALEERDAMARVEARPRERDLEGSGGLSATIVDRLPLGVLVLDPEGTIVECNARAAELLGRERADLLKSRFDAPGWGFRREDGSTLPPGKHPARIAASTATETETVLGLPAGDRYDARWLLFQATPQTDGGGAVTRIVCTVQEAHLDERSRSRRIVEDRHHDQATGTFNRTYLPIFEQTEGKQRRRWGCIVVSIEGLRRINEEHGVETGDRGLKLMARFLMMQVRAGEAVVRLGGAEFAILVTGVDERTMEIVVDRVRSKAVEEAPMPFGLGAALREGRESLEETLHRAEKDLEPVEVLQRFPGRRIRRF